jgi:biopolymer transport protein ExbD
MMPKRSRGGSALEDEVKISMTPMIDVTFLILVFFMCTLQFKTLEAKLAAFLPTDRGVDGEPIVQSEPVRISLRVVDGDRDRDVTQRRVILGRPGAPAFGRFLPIVDQPAGQRRVHTDPPDALTRLRDHLIEVRRRVPDVKAVISVEPEVPHACAITVLDVFKEADFADVSYSGISGDVMQRLQSGAIR